MKRILIILISFTFIQCGSSDDITINTINIGEQEYKMPIISNDINFVKDYLKGITSNVSAVTNDGVTVITAQMSQAESKLFRSFYYEISNENNVCKKFVFKYKYRDINQLDENTRKGVLTFIDENNSVDI